MGTRLKDRVSIVTGAGTSGEGMGNGKAAAMLFAREGAPIVAGDYAAGDRGPSGRYLAFQLPVFARFETQHEHRALLIDLVGSAIKANLGRTLGVVETPVTKLDPAAVDGGTQHLTATHAAKAAYFKHIGEIDPVEEIDLDFHRRADVVA